MKICLKVQTIEMLWTERKTAIQDRHPKDVSELNLLVLLSQIRIFFRVLFT